MNDEALEQLCKDCAAYEMGDGYPMKWSQEQLVFAVNALVLRLRLQGDALRVSTTDLARLRLIETAAKGVGYVGGRVRCGPHMLAAILALEQSLAPAPRGGVMEQSTKDWMAKVERDIRLQMEAYSADVAAAMAHRACCGTEHDPANGKLHGYCVVCGVEWPCETAQYFLRSAPPPAAPSQE